MCGIVGCLILDDRGQSDQLSGWITAMCDKIVHRGPDGQGQFVEGPLGIGMRRLAVIDLEGGRQPVFSEDENIVVVFNGEIYNYRELRRELQGHGHTFATNSDTEVLVHGYEQWGDKLPEKLNGMFGFSLWDRRNRRLFIARDHIGVKPLYLYRSSRLIAWASEIKALLALPEVKAEMDHGAMLDFLRFGYVPAPRTMFRGIEKIPPATHVSMTGTDVSSLKMESYWDLCFESEQRSEDEWAEALREQLDESVRAQLVSDVPLGAFLSGGLDSSSIVASMHSFGIKDISTYAIGFGGEDKFHSELDKARFVARHYGTNHHEIVVEPDVADLIFPLTYHLDEPFTDSSFLVTYLVSKLARESVTVILSGVGGDEIFAGYRRYLGPRLQRYYRWIPWPLRRFAIRPLLRCLPVDRGSTIKSMLRYARAFAEQDELSEPHRYQGYVAVCRQGQRRQLLTNEWAAEIDDHASSQIADYYESAPADNAVNRMLYADTKTSLVDSLLAFSDKMSMAVSLEARVPLLDRKLVEMAARIPPSLKLRGMRGMKHVFKRAMKGRLPDSLLTQKKQGFGTPISRWFRSSLATLVHDLLSPDRVRERGYFRPEEVARVIKEHDDQQQDNSEVIMALVTLEAWHQTFIDSPN